MGERLNVFFDLGLGVDGVKLGRVGMVELCMEIMCGGV